MRSQGTRLRHKWGQVPYNPASFIPTNFELKLGQGDNRERTEGESEREREREKIEERGGGGGYRALPAAATSLAIPSRWSPSPLISGCHAAGSSRCTGWGERRDCTRKALAAPSHVGPLPRAVSLCARAARDLFRRVPPASSHPGAGAPG